MKEVDFEIGIIYEHPDWHIPLFEALDRKGISYAKIDLKCGAYNEKNIPKAHIYYNLVSPSAYLRGNQRAVPYALSLCKMLEIGGYNVLNGTSSMQIEFSKSAQIALLQKLDIDHPRSVVFNSVEALKVLKDDLKFPMVMKPEQGGSGARMFLIYNLEELEELLDQQPDLWLPDNLLLLQEKLEYDSSHGIVRMEFIGGNLLYAMRVVTNGSFNLCPSVVCNPEEGAGHCETGQVHIAPAAKPEFYPYINVPNKAVEAGARIMQMCGHATGSVEYVVTKEGRMVFYDINSNSNLRESIAREFGKQPFDEVAEYLQGSIDMRNDS